MIMQWKIFRILRKWSDWCHNTFRESPESAIFEWIGFWTRPYERFLLYCSPTPGCRASSSSSSSYSIYIWKCNHDETRAHFSNKSQENLFMAVEKYTLLIWQCQTFEVHQFHLKIPSRTNRKWNECGSFALSCCHTHTINNHNLFFSFEICPDFLILQFY